MLNFNTEWDAMRIPSTKRICFVGQFDSNSNLDKIDALLKEKEKFKPRDIKGFGTIICSRCYHIVNNTIFVYNGLTR